MYNYKADSLLLGNYCDFYNCGNLFLYRFIFGFVLSCGIWCGGFVSYTRNILIKLNDINLPSLTFSQCWSEIDTIFSPILLKTSTKEKT